MRVSTRINMGQYSVCTVPISSFVEDYSSGKIQIDSADQPYKDVGNNKTYSNIVSAFLKGIPLPERIILVEYTGEYKVVSGARTLATILHYIGKLPEVDRTLHSSSFFLKGVPSYDELPEDDKIYISDGLELVVYTIRYDNPKQLEWLYSQKYPSRSVLPVSG